MNTHIRSNPLLIRSNHPNTFRSGQWGRVAGTEYYVPIEGEPRAVFVVRWIDGHEDRWPIKDDSARYEFDREVTV